MNSKNLAIVFSVVMVLSSFVGCIETEDDASTDTTTEASSLGNVMVSTYHVAELARAVGGDRITVEIISPSNVPVHDYEPSASDLIRLQDTDLFFYHGLNLEPWVDATISSLGSDAPIAVQTHAMPSGEDTLDYQSMLLSELCEHLNDGPNENVALSEYEHKASDVTIHAEHVNHKISFPEIDDDHDHDDHGDEEGDHDDHDHDDHGDEAEGHDDHDSHEGHNHAGAEKVIEAPTDCPADTIVSIFHLEEGEYVLEFEYGQSEDFDMVVLKMPGGHAHHHHHGHGGPFEWAGIFSIDDDTHTWTMEKVDGEYADPSMRVVIIPTDTPTEETMHSMEGGVEALIEGDSCNVVEDGETMTPILAGGSCFELHVGTGDMSSFTMNTAGISGFAAFTAHSPYEFENTQHYLKDSAGNNVEHIAEEGGGGHDDHDDHEGHDDHDDHEGHDDHDDHGVDEHCNHDHDDHGDGEDDHGDGEDDHDHGDGEDDHGDDEEDHDHGDGEDGHGDEEEDDHDHDEHDHDEHGHDNHEESEEISAACVLEEFDTNQDSHLSWDEFWHAWTDVEDDEDDHDHGDGEDDHGDDEDDHDHGDGEEDHSTEEEMAYLMDIFNEADEDNDELLNLTELDNFIHMVDADDHAAYATIHIEEEGDYGFALSPGIEFFILMDEDAHEGHDHGAHEGGVCHNTDTHENYDSTEEECGAAGHMWMEEDSHDDHDSGACHNTDTHENYDSTEAECEAAGHMWTGEGEIVAGDEEEAFDYDPHSWLSPVAYKAQISVVLDALVTAFPEGEDDFKANAAAYSEQLDLLDADYNAAFGEGGTCEAGNHEKTIVANHNAYAYIAQRYDIEILTIHGLDPEGEPSAADIAEVVEQIEEKGITVLYVEEYTDTSSVDSIVEQTGVTIEILYTMELPPKNSEDTYLTLMNKNLESLVAGIGC